MEGYLYLKEYFIVKSIIYLFLLNLKYFEISLKIKFKNFNIPIKLV